MKTTLSSLFAVMLGLGAGTTELLAQTDGTAQLEATILNYVGTSGTRHWTVAWVTTESGTFIKTLWKQGPSNFPSHYGQHLGVWNTARAGSTALDGYTSATASNYDPPNNNPVDPVWNCRDASNALVPDGNYKFWIQYAEDDGQGPYTTSGLLWTKGPAPATTPYPNQGANFSNMSVTWTPAVATVPPIITSAAPPATGTVDTAYNHTVTATGTPAPTFTATGLPTGLAISAAGVISGTPTAAGTFNGTITAANGVAPDATQAFSIVISAATVAPTITSAAPPAAGTVGTAYNHTVTATGTPAPVFAATGLPMGLAIEPMTGLIAGVPTEAGTFTGTITASNGVNPDATQAFSIVISAVPPVNIGSVRTEGNSLVLTGTGPANGTYEVLSSADLSLSSAEWAVVGTGTIDSNGNFSATVPMSAGVSQSFTKLRVP